jgi:transmembrane sensor
MNPSPSIPNPAAEEQAALWAARLDGGLLSIDDQAALNTWLDADPGHRSLLSSYCQFSADLEEQLPELVAAGRVAIPEEKRRSSRARWFAGLTLAAAALLVFGLWLGQPGASQPHLEIALASAKRETFVLADGTRIIVNANSNLVVEKFADERRVSLLSGEAFFVVAKDKSRPFIVQTPAGAVQVTGTEFNVRSEAATQLEVTVAEGSVKVRPSAPGATAERSLTAGDRLTANGGRVTMEKLSAAEIEDALAWCEGKAIFRTLDEAAARFGRYHGRKIEVEGTAKNISIGSVYTLDDLDAFLESMTTFYGTVVTRNPDGSVVIGPAAEKR